VTIHHAHQARTPGRLKVRTDQSQASAAQPLAVVDPRPGVPMRLAVAPSRGAVNFEINFLTSMIAHHRMLVEMSRLALRYATDPRVRNLAGRIIAARRLEVAQMRRLLAADGVRGYRPTETADDRTVLRDLGSLRGDAFDRAYLQEVVAHYETVVHGGSPSSGASDGLDEAYHPELKRLLTDTVASWCCELRAMGSLLHGEAAYPGREAGSKVPG
jgi:uncharacterized protein (DUF305 family)